MPIVLTDIVRSKAMPTWYTGFTILVVGIIIFVIIVIGVIRCCNQQLGL